MRLIDSIRMPIEKWATAADGNPINPISGETFLVEWKIDPSSYLISPAGTRVARITPKTIFLLDKRYGTGLPFTRAHWDALFPGL